MSFAHLSMQLNDTVMKDNTASYKVLNDLCVNIFTVLHQPLES